MRKSDTRGYAKAELCRWAVLEDGGGDVHYFRTKDLSGWKEITREALQAEGWAWDGPVHPVQDLTSAQIAEIFLRALEGDAPEAASLFSFFRDSMGWLISGADDYEIASVLCDVYNEYQKKRNG